VWVQNHLAGLASGQPTHLTARHEGSLDGFLAGLAAAWQHGEVRATHRRRPRPRRDWRTPGPVRQRLAVCPHIARGRARSPWTRALRAPSG
jgi:hypothetical protein